MNRDFFNIFRTYQEITVRYDVQLRAVWCYFNPAHRPCFSLTMLRELRQMQQGIIDYFNTRDPDSEPHIRYLIQNSQVPGIFNLGGDLALFRRLIKEKNHKQLLEYAHLCVKLCYLNAVNMFLPLTTISLVEGIALGGGFESALSSNILIATENAEMGFPEIRFNLFPGMGAYSFLARTSGTATAEKMISSGEIYGAKALFEMGIVQNLAPAGEGLKSVEKFIRQHQRLGNGWRALQEVRQRYHPLDYQELADVTEIWADAAMRLEDKDLRMIDRLIKAQAAKLQEKRANYFLRAGQDRRFMVDDVSFPLVTWSGEITKVNRRKNQDRRLKNNCIASTWIGRGTHESAPLC